MRSFLSSLLHPKSSQSPQQQSQQEHNGTEKEEEQKEMEKDSERFDDDYDHRHQQTVAGTHKSHPNEQQRAANELDHLRQQSASASSSSSSSAAAGGGKTKTRSSTSLSPSSWTAALIPATAPPPPVRLPTDEHSKMLASNYNPPSPKHYHDRKLKTNEHMRKGGNFGSQKMIQQPGGKFGGMW